MKIQAERPDELAQALQTTNNDRSRRTESTSVTDGPSDSINVSSDARLLNTAVQAAKDAPEIRPAVVERAKAKLMSGTLGADADKLAERMIDHMLKL
jgi:flagellar biosynthesis anti-sigma factor FlgM